MVNTGLQCIISDSISCVRVSLLHVGVFIYMHFQCWHCVLSIPPVFSLLLKSPNFLPSKTFKLWLPMSHFLHQKKTYHTLFFLFICHTVCFAKTNIPTELTPIWQGWHEADGCSSYVERCYRRLTVKSCYLNRVACWHRVACWLLRVHTRESVSAKATDIKLRMTSV